MSTTIIIPTAGNRVDKFILLLKRFEAFKDSIFLIVVCPQVSINEIKNLRKNHEGIIWVEDGGVGIASAINLALPLVTTEFWNWCGDDDYIDCSKLILFEKVLTENPEYSFVYGNCNYVSDSSKILAVNKPKQISSFLIKYSLNLIPQPSVLFRKSVFQKIGGLNENLKYAFDQEYYMRNFVIGKAKYINVNLSNYTWHNNTQTNLNRTESLKESYLIRSSYNKNYFKKLFIALLKYPTYLIVYSSMKYFSLKNKINV